jgi:heme exporter protein B
MNATLPTIVLLVKKDLRVQARARHAIALVVVLGLLIVVVLGLGLGQDAKITGLAPLASLWIAYLFGGVLAFEKTMAYEQADDALAALLLAPIDRGAIYLAKLVTNLLLMAALAVVITPVAIVLFRYELGASVGAFGAIIGLGMIGFAALGTLFSAATSSTRLQGGLLPLLVFPLSLPLIIMTTQMMRRLAEDPESGLSLLGLCSLVAVDGVFVVMGWLIFEFLLEP